MRSLLLLALATPAFAAEPPDVLPAMRETCPVAREYFGDGVDVKPAAPAAKREVSVEIGLKWIGSGLFLPVVNVTVK